MVKSYHGGLFGAPPGRRKKNEKKVGEWFMDQNVLDQIVAKTRELMDAPTCSGETKEAAQKWLDAVGTGAQKAQTKAYIEELEADIMPIDNLIGFAGSEAGAAYFGAEKAAQIVEHAEQIKAAGARYCDCPACAIVAQILEKKDALLAL